MTPFDAHTLPDRRGRTALVTGANSGIGYETARALARAGAVVWLAGRDLAALGRARQSIAREVTGARTEVLRLDLADLASVDDAAGVVLDAAPALDLLVNSAGVMAIPDRRVTADGVELTFGTNHLGHFALTGRLLPALLRADHARVVTVSALVARRRGVTLDDPQSERDYSAMGAYARSKLANLLFTEELARRAVGTGVVAVAVHPGTSRTNLQRHSPRLVQAVADVVLERFVGHTADLAALPSLFAATQPGVRSGELYAPTGRRELRGAPGRVPLPPAAEDASVAARLWDYSEAVTGVRFAFPGPAGTQG